MSNLIEDIARCNDELRKIEEETSEAGFRLQDCKRRLRTARGELDALITELATNKSRYPLFERIAVNGQAITPDEHQRGPTEFPAVPRRPPGPRHEPPPPPITIKRVKGKAPK